MASKIDVSALTLNPQEATMLSEAIQEKVFIDTPLTSIHDIQTGVSMQSQIVFVDNLEIGGEAFTGCTPAEQDALKMTQKYWNPQLIGGRFTHCANDLNQLLKIFARAQKATPDYFDRIGSQEIGLLMAKITQALKESVAAKAWYSDLAAADLPAGNFTPGTNLGVFNQFNGLWDQIFSDGSIKRYTITENAGASYAAQKLAAGESNNIFKGMYELADSRLLGSPDAQILVTRSIWDNYLSYLEDTQKGGGYTEVLEDGRTVMSYRGINIVLMNEWDRTQNAYQNDGTVVVSPNRAVFTTPSNIPLATLSESDINTLESWYEKKDKSNIVDYSYFLDAKFLESYMAVVAY